VAFPWQALLFYCLFSLFAFHHQRHASRYEGANQTFGAILSLSAFLSMIVGFGYLIYCGFRIEWWTPFIFFIIGVITSSIGHILVEKAIGPFVLTLISFIAWPLCAYLMFQSILPK
jgi:hypothetical protein